MDIYSDVTQDLSILGRIDEVLMYLASDIHYGELGTDGGGNMLSPEELFKILKGKFKKITRDIKEVGEDIERKEMALRPTFDDLAKNESLTDQEMELFNLLETMHYTTSYLTGETHV